MRPDTANRAFLALATLGGSAQLLTGIGACVLLSLLAYRVSADGLGALSAGGVGVNLALGFLVLAGAGVVWGLWSLGTQLDATGALVAAVRARRAPLPADLRAEAARARLHRIDLVDAPERFCFTYGSLLRRVAISRGLVEALSPSELAAVLEHERYHVRNFDPLKTLLARTLPALFFYLPVLRDLRRRYIAGRELAADRHAVMACGEAALAGALYKTVRSPAWASSGAAAAIGGPDLLDMRVTQLETGREPSLGRVSPMRLLLSTLGLGLPVASLAAALAGAGGPFAALCGAMPATTSARLSIAGAAVCGTLSAWAGWRVARRAWRRANPRLDTPRP